MALPQDAPAAGHGKEYAAEGENSSAGFRNPEVSQRGGEALKFAQPRAGQACFTVIIAVHVVFTVHAGQIDVFLIVHDNFLPEHSQCIVIGIRQVDNQVPVRVHIIAPHGDGVAGSVLADAERGSPVVVDAVFQNAVDSVPGIALPEGVGIE